MNQLHKIQNKRIRVKSKLRLSICISLLLIIIYPAFMYAIDRPHNEENKSFINIYIEPGDTLWSIAKANLPPKTNIKDFIYEIKKINELNSSIIKEGDYLTVPQKS